RVWGWDQVVPSQVRTRPRTVAAAQKVDCEQDTPTTAPSATAWSPRNQGCVSNCWGTDHRVPSKVRTLPKTSAAMQNVTVGHDTVVMPLSPKKSRLFALARSAFVALDHEPPANTKNEPLRSPPTQYPAFGHDT